MVPTTIGIHFNSVFTMNQGTARLGHATMTMFVLFRAGRPADASLEDHP